MTEMKDEKLYDRSGRNTRIMIIGSPGSGKSHLAKRLAKTMKLPLYHMDNIYWKQDKSTISDYEMINELDKIFAQPSWIIDGNYLHTLEYRMAQCDTIIYLNIPTQQCLDNITERKGKPRSDLPWVEDDDPQFMEYVKNFETEQKPLIKELLEKYQDKNIYILDNRDEIDRFIDMIRQ